ncbi:MAG TPA: ABC transporter permease [Bryobacteraceae bacterium]|jgi:predicted permease|nr:ABC transporter permease [Bryobacteraceae bacterium]
MKTLKRFFNRLRSFATTHQSEQRLQAEIEEHLALETARNLRAGLSPADARRQALLKFGTVEAIRESYRDQRGLPFVETLIQDTRHALRRLRNAPAFTITTILTLALGIGATTSIFTLVHAVILKSLAVANPSELYRLGKESRCCYWGGYSQEKEYSLVSYDLYKHFRDHSKGFGELAAFSASQSRLGVRRAGSTQPAQSYPGEFVSGNYFTMFGINAYAGRVFSPSDDQAGAPPTALMSYRLWQQKYALDPSVIGSVFTLDGNPFTVVGITPPGFFGDTLSANPPDLFLPLNTEPILEGDLYAVNNNFLELIGRIRPGSAPIQVEADMRVELKQWLLSHWGDMNPNERAKFPEQTLFLRPGGAGITSMREEYEHWLQILMLVSGFVLLIVCANVANLMLVRGMERRRQISLSMALGARASRLMRQPLTESILLSLFGGAAGLAIAFACTRLILHFAFPKVAGVADLPISASPSVPVLLFAFVTSLVVGIAFGIAPAWMATRVDPIEALRGAGRSTARAGSLPRKALVVFQAALSLALLSASGLLTTALRHLETQDFGFNRDGRTVVKFVLGGYQAQQLTPLYARIHDSLANIPGISQVALCIYSPMAGNNWGGAVHVDGQPAPGPNDDNYSFWDRVTAGYFDVVGNPILKGRGVSEQDTAASPHIAVVNQAFARKFFGNVDPIGKHFGQHDIGSEREYEIVGVAKDARYLTFQLDQPIAPLFFLPEAQHDFSPSADHKDFNPGSHFMHDIVILTQPGASLPIAQVRQAMASIDPNIPILAIHPLKEQVAFSFTQQRLIARLTSFFGILSLLLASIGLYGVTAYNAGRRTSEIGVRVALGADGSDVFALILRGALALISLGLLLGIPLALAAGRFLGHQLYGINQYNPFVIAISILALASSALIAAVIPAFRASSISPVQALRSD